MLNYNTTIGRHFQDFWLIFYFQSHFSNLKDKQPRKIQKLLEIKQKSQRILNLGKSVALMLHLAASMVLSSGVAYDNVAEYLVRQHLTA